MRKINDHLLWIIATLFAVGVAIFFDKYGMPQKWHAAIFWTGITFGSVISMQRHKWHFWKFWQYLIILFVLHITVMWLVFAVLLRNAHIVGMLLTFPFAFLEGLVILSLLRGSKQNKQNT